MTPDDGMDSTPDHRYHRAVPGDDIEVRQPEEDDGVFEVRMPIATTGEVRNEGDEPLTRDELDGMARQIDDRDVPVFLDHGGTALGGRERYSAVEKVGEWRDADVMTREADDDADELVASARLMDPETLPNGVSDLRAHLGAIKEQVQRGFSLSSSIGWRDDDGFVGGVDLMEASIVGIGADPRTTSDAETAVVARAAVEAGAEPDALVEQVRSAVYPDGERPFGPPNGPPDLWDDFEECVADVEDWEGVDDPEAFCAWAEEQSQDADRTDHDMTDDTDESADAEADTDHDDQPDQSRQEEQLERLVELQEQQMDTLEAIEQSVRQDDEGDEDDEDDDEDEQAADTEDAGEATEPDDAQGLEAEVESLREELDDLRDGGLDADDVDTPDADDEQDADEPDDADDHELTSKYGIEQ